MKKSVWLVWVPCGPNGETTVLKCDVQAEATAIAYQAGGMSPPARVKEIIYDDKGAR